jgi:hypothetical protein
MPRAGNAAVFDRTEGHGGVCMRAEVIDRINLIFVTDQGDAMAVEFKWVAFSFLDVGGIG